MKHNRKKSRKTIWIVLALALALVFAIQSIGLATENYFQFENETLPGQEEEPFAELPGDMDPNEYIEQSDVPATPPEEGQQIEPQIVTENQEPVMVITIPQEPVAQYTDETMPADMPSTEADMPFVTQPDDTPTDAVEPQTDVPELAIETEADAAPVSDTVTTEDMAVPDDMAPEDILYEHQIVSEEVSPYLYVQEAYWAMPHVCTYCMLNVGYTRIKNAPASMAAGSHKQLKAETRDAQGNIVQGVTYAWSATGGAIAINPNTGYIRAKHKGSSTIHVTSTAPDGTKRHGLAEIRVNSSDPQARVTIKKGNITYSAYTVKKGTNARINVRALSKKLPATGASDIRVKNGSASNIRYTLYDLYSGKMVYKNSKTLAIPGCAYMDPQTGRAIVPGYTVRMTYRWDGQVYYYYFKLTDTVYY